MKKIMFSDKFGLTDAVLSGQKTMTRRVIKGDYVEVGHSEQEGSFIGKTADGDSVVLPQPAYNVGEEVAIAQAYGSFLEIHPEPQKKFDGYSNNMHWDDRLCMFAQNSPGYKNKMFVRADLMPHRIKITSTKLERLQDISDEDCYKEGIVRFNWKQWLKREDFGPQKYIERELWSVPLFRESICDDWGGSSPEEFAADSAKTAFAVLIFKMMSQKVWNRNPWVYAYEFELVK